MKIMSYKKRKQDDMIACGKGKEGEKERYRYLFNDDKTGLGKIQEVFQS